VFGGLRPAFPSPTRGYLPGDDPRTPDCRLTPTKACGTVGGLRPAFPLPTPEITPTGPNPCHRGARGRSAVRLLAG